MLQPCVFSFCIPKPPLRHNLNGEAVNKLLECFASGIIPKPMLRSFPIFANMGIPMLALLLPGMIIALLPVVVVEALVIKRRVNGLAWPVFRATGIANVVSTIVGIPLTWFVLLIGEILVFAGLDNIPQFRFEKLDSAAGEILLTILSAPWLGPREPVAGWIIPLATLVLLVPFYFASVWIERLVIVRMLPPSERMPEGDDGTRLRDAIQHANLISYSGLAVLACCAMARGVMHRG